jgi:hypothetical protein
MVPRWLATMAMAPVILLSAVGAPPGVARLAARAFLI